MIDAIADEQSLSYWKIVVASIYGDNGFLPKDNPPVAEKEDDLEKAIQASLQEQSSSRKRTTSAEAEGNEYSDAAKRQKTASTSGPKRLPTPSPSDTTLSEEPEVDTHASSIQSEISAKGGLESASTPPKQLAYIIGSEGDDDDYG